MERKIYWSAVSDVTLGEHLRTFKRYFPVRLPQKCAEQLKVEEHLETEIDELLVEQDEADAWLGLLFDAGFADRTDTSENNVRGHERFLRFIQFKGRSEAGTLVCCDIDIAPGRFDGSVHIYIHTHLGYAVDE